MMEYGYMGMVWVIVSHGLTLYGGGVLRLGFMYAVRFLDMSCLVLFCGVFVSLLSLFSDLGLLSAPNLVGVVRPNILFGRTGATENLSGIHFFSFFLQSSPFIIF